MKITTSHFAQSDRSKLTTKPAISPVAQTTILLHDWDGQVLANIDRLFESKEVRKLPLSVQTVIELQMLYGLRISEVLGIANRDLTSQGLIKVRGAKGSSDRFIYSVRFGYYCDYVRINSIAKLCDYSRYYFYRLYKRLGIYARFNGNEVNSVTHYFRHRLMELNKKDGLSIEDSRKFIGHKRLSSTKKYRNE